MVGEELLAISKSVIDVATPDYPVEMCRAVLNPKNPIFLYKFTDDAGNSKCYKFFFKNRMVSTMLFTISCSGCSCIAKRTKNRYSSKRKWTRSIRTDGRQMLSDPLSNHLPGCVPLDYDDVIHQVVLVGEDLKENIITGNDGFPIDLLAGFPPPTDDDTACPLVLDDVADEVADAMDDDVNEPMSAGQQSDDQHPPTGILPVETLHSNDSNRKIPRASALLLLSLHLELQRLSKREHKRKLPSSPNDELAADMKAENYDADTSVPVPHPILPSLPAERAPVESVRIIAFSPPITFKKTFDAFVFNEDEVEVSVVDGGVLRVRFEKKLLSPTDSRSLLLHELSLPDSVDIDSLSTTWQNGRIVVCARSKSSNDTC